MGKDRTKRTRREEARCEKCRKNREPDSSRKAGGIPNNTHMALLELVMGFGLRTFQEQLEEDRIALCGPRYEPDREREAYRHGHDEGRLVLGGRKITVRRPRVRSINGGELELPTWEQMRSEDPLKARIAEQILIGVTTRKYARSLEPLPKGVESGGISRSSVSRHFVARTREQVEKFFSRNLSGIDLPVVMVDGIHIDDHVLVVALGIDKNGKKHVLGLAEGSTENEEVCTNLFRSMLDRGLSADRTRLFVIDGGKGIRKAIRTVFGSSALIQRCRIHKMRNVLGCLPEDRHGSVRITIHDAWNEPTQERAKVKLKALASRLKVEHPGAASSLLEGLDETLTILAIGVPNALAKILSSTNAIENLMGTFRHLSKNVKRWRGGGMAVRWTATGLMAAEKRFRRIRGYKEMLSLIATLNRHSTNNSLDNQSKVA